VDTHTDHTSLNNSDDHSDAENAEDAEDAGDRAFISPSEPHRHNVHDNNNTTPKEEEEEEEEEQVQIMEQIASFDAVTLWEHDSLPHATENYFARGVGEWVSFAEAVSFSFLSAFFCRVVGMVVVVVSGRGGLSGCLVCVVCVVVFWDGFVGLSFEGCGVRLCVVRCGAVLISLCDRCILMIDSYADERKKKEGGRRGKDKWGSEVFWHVCGSSS